MPPRQQADQSDSVEAVSRIIMAASSDAFGGGLSYASKCGAWRILLGALSDVSGGVLSDAGALWRCQQGKC